MELAELVAQLDAYDGAQRQGALQQLVGLEQSGDLAPAQPGEGFNLHAHTFFSYSGAGYSPTHLAWRAHRQGWWALGTVDFDVLDGVGETFSAADLLGLRAAAGIETRVYVPELAEAESNSPGEPGIMYLVGVGLASSSPAAGAVDTLADMRSRAQSRNREMIARINAYLAPVSIDLERDAAPLTPAGNVTERHILVAYDAAARRRYHRRSDLVAFWADRLGMPLEHVDAMLGETPYPHDAIRNRLMKRGGVGYSQPDAGTFPSLCDVVQATVACGAVPTYAFLDGSSGAESRLEELLELMVDHGIGGMTIIPDRNWNISDPATKAARLADLSRAMQLAEALSLPVLAGTEMNKPGQREMDDFDAVELRPYWPAFKRGAAWLWGHTAMARRFGCGHQSSWARGWMPSRSARLGFFAALGSSLAANDPRWEQVEQALVQGPEGILAALTH